MSRIGRVTMKPKANISLGQLLTLLSMYWPHCLIGGIALGVFTLLLGLAEPVRYRAVATLKVKTFDVTKILHNDPLKFSDSFSNKDLIDQQVRLVNSPEFSTVLGHLVKKDPAKDSLILNWGMGEKFKLQTILEKIGLRKNKGSRVKIDALTDQEIVALVTRISEIKANYIDSKILVEVDALEPETAKKVSEFISGSYVRASAMREGVELQDSLQFLQAQKSDSRVRLVEAERRLKEFYEKNPIFTSDAARKSLTDEYGILRMEMNRKQEDIKANRKLLDFYKQRFSSFQGSSDTTTEVFDKFKQELIELKYQRKKFSYQGYDEKNDGIRELDEKIATIEKILTNSGDVMGKRVVSIGHEAKLSEKMVELQDQIKRQEIELQSILDRIDQANSRSKVMPEKEMQHADLQREVRIAREIFDNISKSLEHGTIRSARPEGYLEIVPSAGNIITQVRSVPLEKRVGFAFFVGFLACFGFSVIQALVRKKIIDDSSVKEMGFRYAGQLNPANSDRAKVLLNLGCHYRAADKDPAIILCSSPSGGGSVSQLLMLTDYLEKQHEKSLLIILGNTDLQSNFVMRSDLGYAKVLSSRSGDQFILLISEDETLYAIKDCLKILEQQYKLRYSMVFLYIQKGIECLAYPLGQQLADKMLLIGPSGRYTSSEYFRLVEGFRNIEEVYVALSEAKRVPIRGEQVPHLRAV